MTERKKKLFRDILDVCKRRCLTARFGHIHFMDGADGDIAVYAGSWYIMLFCGKKVYIGCNSYDCDSDEACQKFFDTVDYWLKPKHDYTIDEMSKSAQRMDARQTEYSPMFF